MARIEHLPRYRVNAVRSYIGEGATRIFIDTPFVALLTDTPEEIHERIMRRALTVDAERYDGGAE